MRLIPLCEDTRWFIRKLLLDELRCLLFADLQMDCCTFALKASLSLPNLPPVDIGVRGKTTQAATGYDEREANGPWLLEIALVVLIILNVGAVILETVDSIYLR